MESASTSSLKESRLSNIVCTAQKVLHNRAAKDVISHGFVRLVATDAVEAGSTTYTLAATAHSALAGHIIKFTSGALANYIVGVLDVDTNLITLSQDLPLTPTAADTFQILAYEHPLISADGLFGSAIGASATGGYTPGSIISAGSGDATVIKASAGTLGFLAASNVNDQECYLKIYNATSATAGAGTPTLRFLIPGNTRGSGTNLSIPPQGINFSTGMAFTLVVEAANNGATGVAAAEVMVNWGYK